MSIDIPRRSWGRKAATLVSSGALLLGCSTASKQSTLHESKVQETVQLAHDPTRIRQLSNIAISQFEKSIKAKSANIWVFSGVCAIISETLPNKPKGVVVADVVPDPGILHVVDPSTGAIFTEAIAWDSARQEYITGEMGLLDKYDKGYKLNEGNQQSNLPVVDPNLRTDTVRFSSQTNRVVSITGAHIPVMNSIDTVTGVSLSGIATSSGVHESCAAAFNIGNPSQALTT